MVAGITVLVLGLGALACSACEDFSTIFDPPSRTVTIYINDRETRDALEWIGGRQSWRMDSPCVTNPDDESLAVSGWPDGIPLSYGRITIDVRNGVGAVEVVDDSGALVLRGSVDDFNWDPWAQFFDAEGVIQSGYGDGRFRLEGNCYY